MKAQTVKNGQLFLEDLVFQLKKFLRCNDDKVVLNYGPTGLKLINWTTNIVQHSNHAVTLYVNDKKEAIIRGHL